MLDLNFVRDNLTLVEEKLRQRGMNPSESLKDFAIPDTREDMPTVKADPARDIPLRPTKRLEEGQLAEAPPTRIDMPVLKFPESVKDLAPPETRDDMPTVDE